MAIFETAAVGIAKQNVTYFNNYGRDCHEILYRHKDNNEFPPATMFSLLERCVDIQYIRGITKRCGFQRMNQVNFIEISV